MKVQLKFIVCIMIATLLSWSFDYFTTNCILAKGDNSYSKTYPTIEKYSKEGSIISHAISFHDSPKYSKNFTHFDYVNPNAPKQGTLKKAVVGTFDSFNTFSSKGVWPEGCYFMYDPLMVRSGDEPYSIYGLIASKVEYAKDYSWIIFHINPNAKFHDNKKITAEDVEYTFNLLITQASPHYKNLYSVIKETKVLDEHRICFVFSRPFEKSILLRLSQLRVLPKHYWINHDINKVSLIPPLASGPYKIINFEAGKHVTYELLDNYWARDLAVNIGRHNFKRLHTDYFRSEAASLESFKKGHSNIRIETDPKNWKYGFTADKSNNNIWIKEAIGNSTTGVRAFAFNIRKNIFRDRKVRQAISLALDFNWLNQHLFYGVYTQAYSIFNNSELAATEKPSAAELKLLDKFRNQLPTEVFNKVWEPVKTDGTGDWRKQKLKAYELLKQAGWTTKNDYLTDKNDNILQFEILLAQSESERFVVPFVNNLKELGIKVKITFVDASRYVNRKKNFDFDMIISDFFPSTVPTTELEFFWGSSSAKHYSGRNVTGISIPALDFFINQAKSTTKRSELITIARIIDRIILWDYVIIPQWFQPYWPMVYLKNIKHTTNSPKFENGLSTWWWEGN